MADDAAGFFGRSLARVEDDRLLRGQGRFVDDLDIPEVTDIAFLRSPYAHARILSVDLAAARDMPGVVAVYDGASVVDRIKPLANSEELRVPEGIAALDPVVKIQPAPILAIDEVNHVGQPIVMVVAETRYLAEDALEVVEIEYEELAAVLDPEVALEPGAPLALLDETDNVGVHVRHGTGDAASTIA
ncbi:MAG: xanthine dehydrogenase family protein molybdopterin-binding subunit, partial [Actinomycetota bacterium]|nr:xanthine dehydrogenase family protein molybdopterin-binding subunit [Actinomycetota bacterium]